MEISVAVDLIKTGVQQTSSPQLWADLGAGSGLFTQALAKLLPPESHVHAIDKTIPAGGIASQNAAVKITTVQQDFIREKISLDNFDGFLMGNSFHFVKEKRALLLQLRSQLNATGRIIIVEYDLKIPNAWVPYPIMFDRLTSAARDSGFKKVEKMHEVPSVYNQSTIYSALLSF